MSAVVPGNSSHESSRNGIVLPTVAAIISGGIFWLPFWAYMQNNAKLNTDFVVHITYAENIHKFPDIKSPHFLFEILLKTLHLSVNLSYPTAAVVCMALCYAGMAAMISYEIGHRAPACSVWCRALAVIAILLASHIFLQTALVPNFYYGYVTPITYHNPTQQLGKLLALAIILLYDRALLTGRPRPRQLVSLAVAGTLSALAKPSFLIAFIPAAALTGAYHIWRRDWYRAAAAMIAILPTIATLTLQFVLTYDEPGSGGIIVAPFVVYGGAWVVLSRLPAAFLFPAAVLVICCRRADPRLLFAWLMAVIGLAESFFLAEGGVRMMQGNFAWTGQTVLFVLYVESLLFLVTQDGRRAAVGWISLAPHVVCGAALYAAFTLLPAPSFL